ncbi:PAS domain-containing protein [Methanospirillum lacunae]|nr:PAS domain S-box protein [Methanospirillum lacunae]
MNPDDISQLDILNFLPDPVFAVNKDHRVIVWNRAMEILTGNSANEVLGRGNIFTSLSIYGFNRPTLIDYILTEDPEIIRMYNPFSRNGDVVEAEITYEKSGSKERVLWGKASLLRSGNGDVIGAIETIRDIFSQKQLECDLRDNEERYKSLFTNDHSVMLIINQESGEIVDANPYACRYYGYSHTDIVRMNITDINQFTRDEIFREMNQAIIEKRNFFEFKHKLTSGEIRDVEVF